MHSQGGETSMMSNGSRWGVKGSSEVSEGLTAVYRYEENLNLANATLGAGNRLSSVGLSGGFGTVTLGQIWSASYNHVGVLTDNGVWSGNQSQTGRTGSALSYSASSGPVSFQIDANMNGDTGRSVDMAQLGMSFDTGAAKVGLAFITAESAKDSTRQSSIGVSVPVGGLTLYSSWSEKEVTTFAKPGSKAVVIPGIKDFEVPGSPTFTVPGRPAVMARDARPSRCQIVRYANARFGERHDTDDQDRPLYWTSQPPDDPEASRPDTDTSSPVVTDWPVIVEDANVVIRDPNAEDDDDILLIRYTLPNMERFNIETGQYDCGANEEGTQRPGEGETDGVPFIVERTFQPAVTAVDGDPGVGDEIVPAGEPTKIKGTDDYELMAKVDPTPETTVKTRHMHAGVSGSLGDTGMSFAINVANHPDSSDGENPWNFNVSKSLGGGASLAFEYIDNDSMETSNEALVQLRVDF